MNTIFKRLITLAIAINTMANLNISYASECEGINSTTIIEKSVTYNWDLFADSINDLGRCFNKEQFFDVFNEEYIILLKTAGAQGNASTLHILGLIKYFGLDGDKNHQSAHHWFSQSAELKYARAQYFLGIMHGQGKGIVKDQRQASDWFLLAAEQGHAKAQVNLAYHYMNGKGIERNPEKSIFWFTKAAEQDTPLAYESLCTINLNQENYIAAHKYCLLAAGKNIASSTHLLGTLYSLGLGVDVDDEQAYRYYLKAAQLGHYQAQLGLGGIYRDGVGTEQNYLECYIWWSIVGKKRSADKYSLSSDEYDELLSTCRSHLSEKERLIAQSRIDQQLKQND